MIDVTAFVETLGKKPVAVFGLGVSGMASVKALLKAGGKVHAWDDNETRRAEAEKLGAKLKNFQEDGIDGHAFLILAPGVPLYHPAPHPVVQKAIDAGVEVIGDLEILSRSGHERQTIGITGTNGKSTTTALTGHILKECGIKASVGGNIGKAVLDMTLPAKSGVLVLEISSYQMDLCASFRPDIGVLLNITPDHIDRHGSMERYVQAKAAMFDRDGGAAIIGVDHEHSADVFKDVSEAGRMRAIPVSLKKKVEGGVSCVDGHLIDQIEKDAPYERQELAFQKLPGAHNMQNFCAAYAVARVMGLAPEDIIEAAKTYPGLPHRMQFVRTVNGVAYVNDSKATNADAASKALSCFRHLYLIAGGRAKDGGLDGLEPYLERIRHVFLIGEAMEGFAKWLDRHNVPYNQSQTLDRAVAEAHDMAQSQRGMPGGAGTVLLSPACASYDQFTDFEARGDAFVELVEALEG